MDIVPSTTAGHPVVGSLLTIVRLPGFDRSARGLLGGEEEAWLDDLLARHPAAGPVIRGTGGVRRLRIAPPGRGKRSGARVIYYHHRAAQRVFLILVYPNRKENLTSAERHLMRKLIAVLAEEE